MKGRKKCEAELLRARLERRMMEELMEEKEDTDEDLLRTGLNILKEIGNKKDKIIGVFEQKIPQVNPPKVF